jgi:ATP-dependent RNA helicase DDX3X
MADNLNMNGLSLQDSQHANGGPRQNGVGRSAYIPPHQRGGPPSGGPPGPGSMDGSAWGPPPGLVEI